jgi:hypothetical protein
MDIFCTVNVQVFATSPWYIAERRREREKEEKEDREEKKERKERSDHFISKMEIVDDAGKLASVGDEAVGGERGSQPASAPGSHHDHPEKPQQADMMEMDEEDVEVKQKGDGERERNPSTQQEEQQQQQLQQQQQQQQQHLPPPQPDVDSGYQRVRSGWEAAYCAIRSLHQSFPVTAEAQSKQAAAAMLEHTAALHSLLTALVAEHTDSFLPRPPPSPSPSSSSSSSSFSSSSSSFSAAAFPPLSVAKELRTSSGTDLASLFQEVSVASMSANPAGYPVSRPIVTAAQPPLASSTFTRSDTHAHPTMAVAFFLFFFDLSLSLSLSLFLLRSLCDFSHSLSSCVATWPSPTPSRPFTRWICHERERDLAVTRFPMWRSTTLPSQEPTCPLFPPSTSSSSSPPCLTRLTAPASSSRSSSLVVAAALSLTSRTCDWPLSRSRVCLGRSLTQCCPSPSRTMHRSPSSCSSSIRKCMRHSGSRHALRRPPLRIRSNRRFTPSAASGPSRHNNSSSSSNSSR